MKCKICKCEIAEGMEVCPYCAKESGLEGNVKNDDETELKSADDLNKNSENEQRTKDKKRKKVINSSVLGMISSIIIIILGIASMSGCFVQYSEVPQVLQSGNSTINTRYYSYGGDAYTGMQNAMADVSRNVVVTAENLVLTNGLLHFNIIAIDTLQNVISKTVGLLITSIGILGLFYFSLQKKSNCFGFKIIKTSKKWR